MNDVNLFLKLKKLIPCFRDTVAYHTIRFRPIAPDFISRSARGTGHATCLAAARVACPEFSLGPEKRKAKEEYRKATSRPSRIS